MFSSAENHNNFYRCYSIEGVLYDEKNVSTKEKTEKQRTRIQKKNEYKGW